MKMEKSDNNNVSLILILNLMHLAEQFEVDIDDCKRNIEKAFEASSLPIESLESKYFIAVMDALICRRNRREVLSISYGESINLESFPEFSIFLKTCGSVKSATKVLEWVGPLIFSGLSFEIIESNNVIKLRGSCDTKYTELQSAFILEASFAAIHRAGNTLLGNKYKEQIIRFGHRISHPPSMYKQYFGCEIEAGNEFSEMVFEKSVFEQIIPGGFPLICMESEKKIFDKLDARNNNVEFIERLKSHLLDTSHTNNNSLESASIYFDINPRTVQRRLHFLGTTFRELQAESKLYRAKELLLDRNNSLENIGETLCFSDRRSFSRAFYKWEGITPTEYRQKHLGTSRVSRTSPID
ncbi:MAG: AraC family transcriptional regulator [Pseudomonadales bacterium]|nr:AraC family transcriptional regulator [Pseudomonadales bacterium]